MPEIRQTISHYNIVENIGQGRMGEFYLAHDTILDRKVALMFLPGAFTGDPERMARFEREAKLPEFRNHSNITGILGLEQARDATQISVVLNWFEELKRKVPLECRWTNLCETQPIKEKQ